MSKRRINWERVRKAEVFFLKHGRKAKASDLRASKKPVLIFGHNTISR